MKTHKDGFALRKSGVKYDKNKPRFDLVPDSAVCEIAKVYTYGAGKYDDWNWAKGMRWGRVFAALKRHLAAWQAGEDNDPESGLSHLAHAGFGILTLLYFAAHERYKKFDDRYEPRK